MSLGIVIGFFVLAAIGMLLSTVLSIWLVWGVLRSGRL